MKNALSLEFCSESVLMGASFMTNEALESHRVFSDVRFKPAPSLLHDFL